LSTVVVKSIDESDVRRQMDRWAAQLLAHHAEIQEIVIFGSFENDTYAPGSDLDVFLFLSHSTKPVRDRISDFLPDTFPVPVDLFPFTRDEIEDRRSSPILASVEQSRWRYDRRVALDSNALTRLIDACAPDYDPASDASKERSERVAMLRIDYYSRRQLTLVPRVAVEYARISEDKKRNDHEGFHLDLLEDADICWPMTRIEERAEVLRRFHGGADNCRILAETEAAGIAVLLTSDKTFVAKLGSHTMTWLASPSEFWSALSLPRGARPVIAPHPSNPLHDKTWWKW
jgi:predicted nucleotidyltransferase